VSSVPDECRMSDQDVSLTGKKMYLLENGYSRPNWENEIKLSGRRYSDTQGSKYLLACDSAKKKNTDFARIKYSGEVWHGSKL
jgi:hypothetical protein